MPIERTTYWRSLPEETRLELLLPPPAADGFSGAAPESSERREKLRRMLREGRLDNRPVEIDLTKAASRMIDVMTP